jgi:hypothetical protein
MALVGLLAFGAGCEAPGAPALDGAWPNEPGGLTRLSGYEFNDSLPTGIGVPAGEGWLINNPDGYVSQARDLGAPFSPPQVGRWRYPIGFVGGQEPATLYRDLDGTRRELYFGYWWKASAPWEGHPTGVNEMSYVLARDNIFVVKMQGQPGGPYVLAVNAEFTTSNGHLANSAGDDPGPRDLFGNVNGGNYVVTPGRWYQIEAYVKMSTSSTSRDGVIRWWVNGTPVGNYTTVNFDAARPWEDFAISPNWGGVGGTKTEEDYFWCAHVRLSVP